MALQETKPINELAGLTVTVNEVLYMPDSPGPAERPHVFVYFITISNHSNQTVRVKGRKWVVRQQKGSEVLVMEGDGVVGQMPLLKPSEDFNYNSQHFVSVSSEAEGAYFVETLEGKIFSCRIPRFELRVPDWI
jgi:ApaG protein